jgi:hypothetical protein
MGVSGPEHPEGGRAGKRAADSRKPPAAYSNPAASPLGHDREVAEVTELQARRPQLRAPVTSRVRSRLSVERV